MQEYEIKFIEVISYSIFITELGESILNVLGCLVPFLENDLLDSLPYTVASTLAIFPPTLHKDTIDLLCSNLLPMTLGKIFHVCLTVVAEKSYQIYGQCKKDGGYGGCIGQVIDCETLK